MNVILKAELERLEKKRNSAKRWRMVVISLCAAVALGTSYILINPAQTAQQETYCGFEEHAEHTDDCYEKVLVCELPEEGHAHSADCFEEQQVLTCTLPETDGHVHSETCYGTEEYLSCTLEETDGHQHGEACYAAESVLVCENADPEHVHGDECYEQREVLVCGENECEAHHHDENCYSTREVLICGEEETPAHHHDGSCYAVESVCVCGMEESEPHEHGEDCYEIDREHLICDLTIHEHTLQCFSDPEADVETSAIWKRTFERVELTGNWNEDVIAIAKTQLGYAESTANYEVQADGTTMKGYTRYGAWYGVPYGDWCAMFCSFCMNYAEVDSDLIPFDSSCTRWIEKLSDPELDLYHLADNRESDVMPDASAVLSAGGYIPVPGDLIFFDNDRFDPEHPEDRKPDHVGFVLELVCNEETHAIEKIKTLEGNAGDAVCSRTYDWTDSSILGFGELPVNPDYVEPYPVPDCDCGVSGTDLISHNDNCARKTLVRTLCAENSAEELRGLWKRLPEDVSSFALTYLGWTDNGKLAELNSLLASDEIGQKAEKLDRSERAAADPAEDLSVPECDCASVTLDLISHNDNCARKAFVRALCEDNGAEDLLELWKQLPEDVSSFALTYMSWTDSEKLAELNALLASFDSGEPEKDAENDPKARSLPDSASGPIYVVAASDFQDPSTSGGKDYSVQSERVQNILSEIGSTYGTAYGFLAGGDYNYDMANNSSSKTQNGVNALKTAVTGVMGSDVRMVLVSGNHDAEISDLSSTGAHDTDYYGVYAIAQSAYPQRGGTESGVQATADGLSAYLEAKADAGYDKPVFIVTHVPLHYSTRCKSDGDAKYASLIFDAISEYGDDLNIFFLYGHDHANGNDDYLGGTCVFLTRGDTINIADKGSTTSFTARELNFTYMNCGFVGYFWDNYSAQTPSVAESTLNMSVFCIEGSTVTVSRWTENGQYAYLKSAGVAAPSSASHGAEVCPVTDKVYLSPQVVSCLPSSGEDPVPEEHPQTVPDSSILSDWDQLTSAEGLSSGEDYDLVAAALADHYSGDFTFSLYDILAADGAVVPDEGVRVYLPADKEMDVFGVEDGALVWHDAEFVTVGGLGYMRFTAYHFSLYGTAGSQSGFSFPALDSAATPVISYTEVSSLSNGDRVIIQNTKNSSYLSSTRTNNNDGLLLQNVSQANAEVWTVEADGSTYYLKNSSGRYLSLGDSNASTSRNRSAWAQYVSGQSCWQLVQNSSGTNFYLNLFGGSGTRAAGYNVGASNDNGSRWKLYKVTETVPDSWVRCNNISDVTPDGTYMIVSRSGNAAIGVNNGIVSGTPTVTANGTIQGRTRYVISGAGSGIVYQWKFTERSNGGYTLTNLNSNTNISIGNNYAFSVSNLSDPEQWRLLCNSYYLVYSNSAFSASTNTMNADMYIYKKAEPVTSQLAVQKLVPSFNTLIDTNTEFTFRLLRADSNNFSNASLLSASYDLYDYEGTKIGSGTLQNGTFTLKAGQTALFSNPDVSKYYFVEEAVHANVADVAATVNNNSASLTATSDGNYYYVRAAFSNGNRSMVKVTNTPEEDTPGLRLSLELMGENDYVDESTDFVFLLTDDDGNPVEYDSYVLIDAQGEHTLPYDASDPSITLNPGESVLILGLQEGTYLVHQYLGDNTPYISYTLATVDGSSANPIRSGTEEDDGLPDEVYFSLDYSDRASAEIVNVLLESGTGSGTSDLPPLVMKEPDHHKYIDAFRDGDDNPETDLDDKARRGELDECIEDLYRLYLDLGPESAYEEIDVLFVVDSSTSMSGFTGYDATDILGNRAWRCFALDTLLLGQDTERSAGSGTSYTGSGNQSASQHQRTLHDNGLIGRIAYLNPNNKVAVTRFSWDSDVLLDWTVAKDVTGIKSYSNISGTNYAAGLTEALDLLQDDEVREDGNKKYLIFISDGLPTRYYTSLNPSSSEIADPPGTGSETPVEFEATDDRFDEFLADSVISSMVESGDLEIYTVAVGNGTFQNNYDLDSRALLNKLSTDNTTFESTDFGDILKLLDTKITSNFGHYTNLKVTDQLSDYVDFYDDQVDLLIEKIPKKGGTAEILYENGALTDDGLKYIKPDGVTVDLDTETLTVDFLDNYKEEGGYNYRISFNVITTQDAYDEYAENEADLNQTDGYGGVRGAGSESNKKTDYAGNENYTSSGLPGFFSNKRAILEYTQARLDEPGITQAVEYAHPVIQVWTTDLTVNKTWSDLASAHTDDSVFVDFWRAPLPDDYDPDDGIPESVRSGGTKIATAELNAANGWTYTLDGLPRGYFYYVTEQADDAYANYSPLYEPNAVAVPHDASGTMHFYATVSNVKDQYYLLLKKTDMAGSPLQGAVFKLYKDQQHAVEACQLVVSGTDGVFTPSDLLLQNGTYYLVEKQAPPGYNGLTSDVVITVSDDGITAYYGEDYPLEVTVETAQDGRSATYAFSVPNSSGYVLPETGGVGTLPIYALGAVLVAVSLMFGYKLRRKRERRAE